MNNIYSWHSEVMVILEMEDLKREIDSIRLIRDAGLSKPGLLERTAVAMGNALVQLGQRLHDRYMNLHQADKVTTCKFAT